ADLGAGEHLFRLPGRCPAALPPGARAEGQEPAGPKNRARKRRGALLCRRRCRYRARQGPWTACRRYPQQDPGTLRRASAFLASAIKKWPENGKPPEGKRAE